MVTIVQVNQIAREVLMDRGPPAVQVAQVARDVLMDRGPPALQVSGLCREVLMSDVPAVVAFVPPKIRWSVRHEEPPVHVARRITHPIHVQYVRPTRVASRIPEEEPRPHARWVYPIQPTSPPVVTIRPFIFVQT